MTTPIALRLAELCEMRGCTPEDVRCRCRKPDYVQDRRVIILALWHCKDERGRPAYSESEIARAVERDHATIIHHIRKAESE